MMTALVLSTLKNKMDVGSYHGYINVTMFKHKVTCSTCII